MPYSIIPVGKGYKVMSQDGRTFSRKPLSKKQAQKQRTAIALSEVQRTSRGEVQKTKKPMSFFYA